MTKISRSIGALLLAAALATSACSTDTGEGKPEASTKGTPQTPDSPRAAENRAVVIARQDPGTLDYTTNLQTALVLWIPGNVVETLLKRDPEGNIGPGVAEFEVGEDGKQYVFTIRDNQFSDGAKVTAEDVLFSLEAMKNSAIANHAAAYVQVDTMKVTGDAEVTVELKQPSQAFFQGVAGIAGLIQPEAQAGSIATNPMGSGPFKLEEYTPNSRMVFSRNENYKGTAPALEEIEVRIITDGAAALNALKSGEADMMPVINNDLFERLKSDKMEEQLTLIENPARGEKQYLALNSEGPTTANAEARQAFARSVNRAQIIESLNASWAMIPTCDYGLTSESWVSEESDETCPYPADLAAAGDLATSVGLTEDVTEFVSLSDVPDLSLPADVLVEQFKAAGIQIERNPIDLARYSQLIFQGRPPQFGVTNMSDPAPITQFTCPDPAASGWTTYCSKEFTDLVEKADLATSVKEYNELLGKANEQLKKDAYIVPLSATVGIGLAHPKLAGADAASVIFGEVPLEQLSW
ncbi:ABC transporter substrate-binding protein [Tessaracoccus sp.]